MNSRTLQRRLQKLEEVLNVLSTEDKWTIVHERALRLLSDADREALEEIAMLEIAGGVIAQTPECVAAMARFDNAFWTAMSAANVTPGWNGSFFFVGRTISVSWNEAKKAKATKRNPLVEKPNGRIQEKAGPRYKIGTKTVVRTISRWLNNVRSAKLISLPGPFAEDAC